MYENFFAFLYWLFSLLFPVCISGYVQDTNISFISRFGRFSERHSAESEEYRGISKLNYEKLQIYSLCFDANWKFWKRVGLELHAELGGIGKGIFRDTDYFYRDSSLKTKDLVCSSAHSAGDGDFADISLAIGYSFFPTAHLQVTPLLGFKYRQLVLNMTNGRLIYAKWYDLDEKIRKYLYESLCSCERNRWYSPWIGLNINWTLIKKWSSTNKLQLHVPLLYQNKYWNMRNLRFTETTIGLGFVAQTTLSYSLGHGKQIGIRIGYEFWDTEVDALPYSFPDPESTPEAPKERITIPAPDDTRKFENVYFGIVYSRIF